MATNWTTKKPFKPFEETKSGAVYKCVVILREYDRASDLDPGPASPNVFNSRDYMVTNTGSVFKEGLRVILDAYGKEFSFDEFDEYWSSDNINSSVGGEEIARYGSQTRAILGAFGISRAKFKSGTAGHDIQGPFYPPRPGVNYVLYKVMVNNELFKNYQTKPYVNRTTKILSRGNDFYKEIEFANFEELSTYIAEVSAVLKEYETEHQKLQTRSKDPKMFFGPIEPNVPKFPYSTTASRPQLYGKLDLTEEGEKLDELNFRLKDYFRNNNFNLTDDKIAIGFYATPKNLDPSTSLDQTETAEAEVTLNTETAQDSTETEINLPEITTRQTDPTAYTNKYRVSAGDSLWKITSFYLGAGPRWKQLRDLNSGKPEFRKRGWKSSKQIKSLEEQLANTPKTTMVEVRNLVGEDTGIPGEPGFGGDVAEQGYRQEKSENPEYEAIEKKLKKAQSPLIHPGDILDVPSNWLDEIASKNSWPSRQKDGATYITFAPALVNSTPVDAGSTPISDDGPSHIAREVNEDNTLGEFLDPWEMYDLDSMIETGIGVSNIAYIKRYTKKYEKAMEAYQGAKSNNNSSTDIDKTTLETRLAASKAILEENIVNERIYVWADFLGLVYSDEYHQKYRTTRFLSNLDILVNEPGVKGALTRYCSPSKKPPKKAKKISAFVKKYIYDPPKLRDAVLSGDDEALYAAYLAKRTPPFHTPQTEEQVNAWNSIVKSPAMKFAVSNRTQKFSNKVGDAVFASLPRNVNKIDSLDDVHRYILSRLSIPQMAEELMRCLGLTMSLDDIIEALCDGFLKKIGADPDKIDEFFVLLKSGEYNPTAGGLEFLDTAELAQDLQRYLSEAVAAGVDDPFYSSVIKQNINNAQGKRFICELVLGAMFALADMLANLETNPNPYDQADDSIPPVPKCSTRFSFPRIPTFGNLLKPIFRQIEQKIYDYLNKIITNVAKDLIEAIIEACAEPEPEFGPPLPPVTNEQEFKQAFAPLTGVDPRDFLSHLLSILTANELCQLVNGSAGKPLLLQVRKFMKLNYPEYFDKFSTNYKIFSFFKNLQGVLDLSACTLPSPEPKFSLDNLCKDGVTPRQEALRNALLAKGLTEEEVQEQLDIDKEIKKDIVSDLVNSMYPDDKSNSAAQALDINSVIAESKVMEKGNDLVIGSMFQSIQNSIYSEVGAFIPIIFNEINKLKDEGNYTFTKLPVFDVLQNFAYADWLNKVSGFSSSDPNVFRFEIPQIKFDPGMSVEQQVKTLGPGLLPDQLAALKDIPGTYSVVLQNPKTIVYDMASYNNPLNNNPKYDDLFFFSVKDTYGAEIFSSEISADGLEIKDETVKQALSTYMVDNSGIPRQIDVFNQFLEKKIRDVYVSVKSGLSNDGQTVINNSLDNLGDWYGLRNLKRDLVPYQATTWSLGEYIYDTAFISIIDRITKIITSSEYFDLDPSSPLARLDLLAYRLGDLQDIKNETKKRVNLLMGSHDFTKGEPPTYLGSSLFEGALKSIIKIELIQNLLRTTFVFSKFKMSDAFSDVILQEYMVTSIKKVKNGEIYALYRKYLLDQEKELRNKLAGQGPRSKPPGPILSDQQIEDKIKKQVYSDQASGVDEYIMSFVQIASEALKDKLIQVFGGMQKAVDERVDLAEKGLTQNLNQLALEGNTSKAIDHVHTYKIDENGNGIAAAANHPDFPEIYHEHTIQNFVVQYAESETAPSHGHQLQLKDYPIPVINTITVLDSDLDSENWANSTTSNDVIGGRSSTCMQECFWDDRKHLAEVPAGTILPPGTNWDASESILATLDEPKIEEIGWGPIDEYTYLKKINNIWSPITVDKDKARGELYDVVHSAREHFEDHFEGFYNPAGKTVESYDSDIWSDLLAGSANELPETNWTKSNPFIPYFGVEYYWKPSSGDIYGTDNKSDAFGYKLIAKKTHSYQARPPRNASEWSSYASGQFIQDGVHSTLIGGATAEDGNFFFGQNVASTESLSLYDEGREFPLIRLSVPTRGHEELNIHHVTEINLQINGENLNPNARAMLVSQNFGHSYDVIVNSTPENAQDTDSGDTSYANVLDITIPILCHAGKHSYDKYGAENNDIWGDSGDHNATNSERLKGGHGHIDEINGKTVVDDVYVLQIVNPDSGQTAAAPIYFHTFRAYGRNWKTNYNSADNNSWRDHSMVPGPEGADFYNNYLMPSWNGKGMQWPQGKPSPRIPFKIGPKPDEGLNQFFALTTYGSDDQAWDIFDVADVTGIKEDNVQISESGYNFRKSVVCAPRLTRKESVEKLRNGGFILEKYIKIKFKSYPEIANRDQDLANRIYAGTAAEGFINLEENNLGQHTLKNIYDKLTVDLDPEKMDKIAALISQNITGFVGQGEIEASEKIEADIFRFAKFDQVPGLVAGATNPQILSYNAFSALQQTLLGFNEIFDPETSEPSDMTAFSSEVSTYLDQKHFTEIVEDVSYGLRVCYVAPFLPFENASIMLLNMFSPNGIGNEYQGLTPIDFDQPPTPFMEHLTKAKAQNKLFHLVEYDGYVPGMYKLPPGSIVEGIADVDFAETSYSEGVIDSDINNIKIKGPASQVGGSLLGEFEQEDVIHTKVMKNVFVLPIAEAEISHTDPDFPSASIKTFQDLKSAYPAENPTAFIPFGKEMYDNLYVKLKTSPDFKLMFDYILPAKRALAMSTIYNMLAFDSVFPDPCKFQNLFSLSKGTALGIAEVLIKDLTMTTDLKPVHNQETDIVNLLRQVSGMTDSCPMPAFNPDIFNAMTNKTNILGDLFVGQGSIIQVLSDQLADLASSADLAKLAAALPPGVTFPEDEDEE